MPTASPSLTALALLLATSHSVRPGSPTEDLKHVQPGLGDQPQSGWQDGANVILGSEKAGLPDAVKGGGRSVPVCEQFNNMLRSIQACNHDEFMTQAWTAALELDCQLEKQAKVLFALAQKLRNIAAERSRSFETWLRAEQQQTPRDAQANPRRCSSKGDVPRGHAPAEGGSKSRAEAAGPRHALMGHGAGGAPTWCELSECPESCSRCKGQMYYTLPDGQQLLMLPEPHHNMTTSYAYDGEQVRPLNGSMEVIHFDAGKINKGLWYATLLADREQVLEVQELFLGKGVHSRLMYRGYDPAIVLELDSPAGVRPSSMCIGFLNRNFIDSGNLKMFGASHTPWWLYWEAPRTHTFAAVASQAAYDENNDPMGTISNEVNMSALTGRIIGKLNITERTYTAIVDMKGHIIAISHQARKTLFREGITDEDIFDIDKTPVCNMQLMSEQQQDNCTWTPSKALTLAHASDGQNYSGSNISDVLGEMLSSRSNCSIGMQEGRVFFPKATNGTQWHIVSFCVFNSVPDWGLILGAPEEDLVEAARMSLSPVDTRDGHQAFHVHGNRVSVRVSLGRKARGRRVPSVGEGEVELLHEVELLLRNDGAIPLPYEVILPAAVDMSGDRLAGAHAHAPFGVQMRSSSRGPLFSGETTTLSFVIQIHEMSFEEHSETIIIKADEHKPRGTCFRTTLIINLHVDNRRSTSWLSKLVKDNDEVVVWAIGLLLVMVFSVPAIMGIRYGCRRHIKHEAAMKLKLDEAMDSTSHLSFPMVLMSASNFKMLGQLVSHEELQQRHKDVWLYSVQEIKEFCKDQKIIFLSHQWTAFSSPDPSNVQYNAMVMSIETLRAQERWSEERTFVWVDYASIPQKHRGTQTLAINSLTAYASNVAAFVVVAPPVQHKELVEPCNKETYQRRAWCRAEQLSHLLALGSAKMYLAEGDILTPLTSIVHWLEQSKYVFQGDLTCCRRLHEGMDRCDKELLVVPMLGLWAQLCRRCEEEPVPEQVAIQQSISERLDEVFPRSFTLAKKGHEEERPLFGDLLDRFSAKEHLRD